MNHLKKFRPGLKECGKKAMLYLAVIALTGTLCGCCKDKVDPLENVAGVYKGSMSDGRIIYTDIQANVTVGKVDGKSVISSVGFSGAGYQMVLNWHSGDYSGNRRGVLCYAAKGDVSVSGGVLNVRGGVNDGVVFSFTGTK